MSGNTRLETPPSLPQEDGVSSSSSISYSSDDLCDEADHLTFASMSPLLHSTLMQTAPGGRYGTSPHLDTKHQQEEHAGNGSVTPLPPVDSLCRGVKNDAGTSVTGSVSSQSLDSLTADKDAAKAVTSNEDVMVLGDGNDNKTTLLSSGDSDEEEEDDDDDDDSFMLDERLPSDEEEIELDSEDENEEDDDSDDEEEDDEDEEEAVEEEAVKGDEKEKEGETEATVTKEEAEGNEEALGDEKTAPEETEKKADKEGSSPKEPKPGVSSNGKGKVSVGKKRKRTTTKGRKEKKKKRVKVKKAAFERRNIRKLISENALDAGTLAAQMEERERKRRILELREKFQQQREQMQPRLSELQSLLDGDLDDDPMPSFPLRETREKLEAIKTQVSALADNDVVLISSSEEDEDGDNDVVMVQSDHEDEDEGDGEEEDINNSGSHINDEMNQPDAEGRVLVNIGHPPDDPDIYLLPQIARVVKPHQIGGIRFLYDNLVEALARYKMSHGFGCVLAHSMGLGKTIQLVAFIDIFLRYTGAKHVMVIVPVNTLQNWMYEFHLWTPTKGDEGYDASSVSPREFDVHVLNDNHRTMVARAKVVNDWFTGGGVLLIGYEMYRLLTSRKFPAARGRKAKTKGTDPVIIDLIEEDQNKELLSGIHEALMRPGPDLVICDEGHRIKNSHAGISKALKNIRTRRRVVLTGYPLQNNLLEYWCMVDFVRPNFLGSRTEFSNMFERPIMNGQCLDSTAEDVRLMRFRAHVLHSLLEGFVQRRGHDVLTATLPRKEEYTLLIRMSPVQRRLYTEFMGQVNIGDSGWVSTNPLKAFAVCCKIWNHPDVLYMAAQKHKKNSLAEDNDIDLEEIQEAAGGTKKAGNKVGKTGPGTPEQKNQSSPKPTQEITKMFAMMDRKEQSVSYEWADALLKNYSPGMLENSGKMVLMMSLIDGAVKVNDKTLIFSQSLFTLDLIEEFLSKRTVPSTETEGEGKEEGVKEEEGERKEEGKKWQKNVNYVRLDGSTSGMEREKLINQFNNTENSAIHVFLLSTRAGCLGINLIGANRVIVFDASWNPCHDSQAVCRVYRYGQFKECFVYRFVTDNTMEKKIYDRQLNKQGISDRVVDELNPTNAFTRKQVDVLLQYQDQDLPHVDISKYLDETCNDPVLTDTLKVHHPWISREPFCHDRKSSGGTDQKLTKSEKQLARRGYEMEKRLSVNFTRPNYSNFYPKNGPYGQLPPNPLGIKEVFPRNRPIASVPPMMSTPVPRRVSSGGQMGAARFPVQAIMRPGVSVQQILTTTDIIVPGTNSATNAQNSRIPAGENVLVIKTPRGVYLRTRQGKIFAVRTTPKDTVLSVSESTARVTSSGDTTMSGLSTLASMASTSTATSCSTYAVSAAATPTATTAAATTAATTTTEKPADITDAPSSDETMHDEKSGGDMGKTIPSPKPLPVPVPIPPSKGESSTGVDKDKPGPETRSDSDVCITGEKPGNGGSFPGGGMAPQFYNYPGMYGGYHGMMPPVNMFGTNTGGAGSAGEQKKHSSYAPSNSYMPPSDMFGGYGAAPWLSQVTASWPQHFPDFMQPQQAAQNSQNSQNGRKEGQRKEQWEGKEGSDASSSQELFVENTDSVDDSLAEFNSLLGLSTNASSSDSATTPTTRGSPTMPDWPANYGMPPYMTYPYGMPAPQSCGMPSGSGAGGMGGQMAYMPPLYHSHPSFMSGGYVHSLPPAGINQPSYNMPPISAFDAGHSVQKMLHSASAESLGESNGSEKDTAQGASTS